MLRDVPCPTALNARQAATVLAALRLFQSYGPDAVARLGYFFLDQTPLNDDEIDQLCEALESKTGNEGIGGISEAVSTAQRG